MATSVEASTTVPKSATPATSERRSVKELAGRALQRFRSHYSVRNGGARDDAGEVQQHASLTQQRSKSIDSKGIVSRPQSGGWVAYRKSLRKASTRRVRQPTSQPILRQASEAAAATTPSPNVNVDVDSTTPTPTTVVAGVTSTTSTPDQNRRPPPQQQQQPSPVVPPKRVSVKKKSLLALFGGTFKNRQQRSCSDDKD